MNCTKIDDLNDIHEYQPFDRLSINTLSEKTIVDSIADFDLSLNDRLFLFSYYHEKYAENVLGLVNQYISIYLFSSSSNLQDFLIQLIDHTNIHVHIKFEIGKCISDNDIYEPLFRLCSDNYNNSDITLVYRTNALSILSNSENSEHDTTPYFTFIISNTDYECDYRYKIILSLETTIQHKENSTKITKALLFTFIHDENNLTVYRILAGQNILQNHSKHNETVCDILLTFSRDNELDEHLRADAADVVLQLGTDDKIKEARELIILLGRSGFNAQTVYDDRQNAHNQMIEDSSTEIIEKIHTYKSNYRYEQIVREIEQYIDHGFSQENTEKIVIALKRIEMDRVLYGKFNSSLKTILEHVWSFIQVHELKEFLVSRLIEELIEMSNMCSTGYITRMANTFSGVDDFQVKIGWQDQIIANVANKLRQRMENIKDEDKRDEVLSQMVMQTEDIIKRIAFLEFFRSNIGYVREELWDEFINYIDELDFEFYMRNAISHFEIGEY